MKNFVYFIIIVLILSSCSKEKKSTVVDWEGHVYKTKNYGGTWWMVENMRTTKTKDGQNILVSSDEDKFSYTTPYCYYNNDDEKKTKKNGCLYNWAAATQICPEGWHLPTVEDFQRLTEYMGNVKRYCYDNNPEAISAAMSSNYGWADCEEYGTPGYGSSYGLASWEENASGFNAPPAGYFTAFPNSHFDGYSFEADFWLANEYELDYASTFYLYYSSTKVYRDTKDKVTGLSVRCVKD